MGMGAAHKIYISKVITNISLGVMSPIRTTFLIAAA